MQANAAQLTQCLRRAALIRPHGTATIDGERRRSWSELASRVARAAAGLRSLGLRPGERAAVLALNHDSYLEAYFAVPWAGAVIVPLNTRLSLAELQFMLDDCGATLLCVDESFLPMVPALRAHCPRLLQVVCLQRPAAADALPCWDDLVAGSAEMEDAGACGSDLAAICYTGGSTGRSKGVMLSHDNLVANGVNACTQIGYDPSSVFLHAAPMFHLTDGMSTVAVTMAAGTHVFIPKFDALQVLQEIEHHQVTNLTLVPTMIAMLLEVPGIEAMTLGSLRQLMFGSAPIPEATLRKAVAVWPQVLFLHGWGMTELSPLGTLLPLPMRVPSVAGPRLASCGIAMPNLELRIADAEGRQLPPGRTGEIVVRGPTVMQGYWNMPAETAHAFRDGWFHTGDAALMDEDGFVYIVDRLKDMIISGGENVYSTEVENAISLMPGVAQVAVIGIPDDKWGEAVHAIVVPQQPDGITSEDVIAWARVRLAGYKAPRSISLRAEPLPLSGAGKVLKTELRAPFWDGSSRRI